MGRKARRGHPQGDEQPSVEISSVVDLRPRRPPVDWDEAKRLYEEEGWTFARLARHFGYSFDGFRRGLVQRGVVPRATTREHDAVERAARAAWKLMRRRCLSRAAREYSLYGGRGVTIAPEWDKFEQFHAWARDAGFGPSSRLVLAEGATSFSPAACHVVGREEARARRFLLHPPAPRRLVTAFGETKGVMAWARDARCKVGASTLKARLQHGIEPEAALTSLPGHPLPVPGNQRCPRRSRPPIDWAEARRLYEAEHVSMAAAARAVHASLPGVANAFRRLGVQLRRPLDLSRSAAGEALRQKWRSLISRCTNPRDEAYAQHGAKGVIVAESWSSFEAFYRWAIDAGWKPGLALIRIDRAGPYSPANCRIVTRSEAAREVPAMRKPLPSKIRITAFRETMGAFDWARDPRCKVTGAVLLERVRGGWHPEDAISTPPESAGTHHESRFIDAFGETKSLSAWTRDPRCRVTVTGLALRLDRGISPEDAITVPSRRPIRSARAHHARGNEGSGSR